MITSQGWRAQAATTRMITEGKRQSLLSSWAKEPNRGVAESCFPVPEQKQADQHKARRPEPAGPAPVFLGRFDLEPACPPCADAQHGNRQVRRLDEQLFLHVAKRVRMRQQ